MSLTLQLSLGAKQPEERKDRSMRKSLIALVAVTTLGGAALAQQSMPMMDMMMPKDSDARRPKPTRAP